MEVILESLAQYGIAGIFLMVLIYYLNKLTDIHREERKEWTDANNGHVNKFAEVIKENTRELTVLRENVKENKCKV
jgi:endo-alpha-1,4-polygalactosaminidase (GH114 family)